MPDDERPVPNEPPELAPPPEEAPSAPVRSIGRKRPPMADLEAEAALLGSVLEREDVAWPAASVLSPADFAWPSYQLVFGAMQALADQGRAIGPISVADELRTSDVLHAVGTHDGRDVGIAAVWTLASPGIGGWHQVAAYADIVRRHAIERRVAEASDRALSAAKRGDLDTAAEALDVASAAIVSGPSAGLLGFEDVAPAMRGEEPEVAPSMLVRDDGQALMYPGLTHWLMGEPGKGKAQPLESLVLTPTGWRRMGDLSVGDEVIGSDGHPTAVTGVFPQGTMPIYRVTTSDGGEVEACGDHLWLTFSHNDRVRGGKGRVRTTTEIRDLLVNRPMSRQLHLPVVAPVQFPRADLPVDPYLLGLLLGDGCLIGTLSFTSADEELHDAVASLVPEPVVPKRSGISSWLTAPRGRHNPLLHAIRSLGLYDHLSPEKFVPAPYLLGNVDQRLALLQGLMDADGCVTGRTAQYASSSPQLITDVVELVRSLGGTTRTRSKLPRYTHLGEQRVGRRSYIVNIRLPDGLVPFRLGRKVVAWSRDRARGSYGPERSIVAVDYVGDKPARCISVAASDRLYVTEDYIVTHNTWVALHAVAEVLAGGGSVLYLDWEGNRRIVGSRLRALGVDAQLASERLNYLRPPAVDRPRSAALASTVRTRGVTLVICDGVAKALARQGLNEDKAPEVLAWLELVVNPLAEAGAAVLMLDHVTKDRDGRGMWARGSGAKLGEVSGAAWLVVPRQGFSRHQGGRIDLLQAKDREGYVAADGSIVASVAFMPADGGTSLSVRVKAPESAGEFRPTGYMERVSRALEGLHEPVTYNGLRTVVSGKERVIKEAVDQLVTEGFVVRDKGPNRSLQLRSVRPFRESDEEEQGEPQEQF